MCIVLFSWQPLASPSLVLAANRDEFHQRPAEAARWRGDVMCGLDLSAGGTWLGVTRSGQFAVVTNYREPVVGPDTGRLSRGKLPLDFLRGGDTPEAFMRRVQAEQEAYGAFNLLVGDVGSLWYMSNRGVDPQPVAPGIHGLSNGRLDEAWPKVERGKRLFAEALANGGDEALLRLLRDTWRPDDPHLPNTGVGLDLERLVSPIFIYSPSYGTRASTVVQLGPGAALRFVEQRWDPDGSTAGRTSHDQK